MDMTASSFANAPDNTGDGTDHGSEAPYITFLEAMRPLTGKWKIEILWVLAQRTLRFGELRRSLPVHETSARSGAGVEAAFADIATRLAQ